MGPLPPFGECFINLNRSSRHGRRRGDRVTQTMHKERRIFGRPSSYMFVLRPVDGLEFVNWEHKNWAAVEYAPAYIACHDVERTSLKVERQRIWFSSELSSKRFGTSWCLTGPPNISKLIKYQPMHKRLELMEGLQVYILVEAHRQIKLSSGFSRLWRYSNRHRFIDEDS